VNRLFLKIFLWFWATVILLGIALVLAFVLGPKGSYMPWQNMQGVAAMVVGEMDRHGTAGANDLLRSLDRSQRLEACLFDENGSAIAGDYCPSFQQSVHSAIEAERANTDWNSSVYRTLVRERSRYGETYYLATQLPFGPPAVHKSFLAFITRLGILLLVSSAVCYLLTLQLTRPILRLRHASMQIAEGKLDARVDSSVELRGDEFGDLGRDFNAMATRIQDLLSSQRQLISDVSHEVRSPLARMNLALDLGRRRLGNDPAFDRLAVDIEKLNEMIGRLLTVAKLESGAVPTAFEPIDLVRLVTEIVEDAHIEASERNCTIVFTCEGEYKMPGDENLLRSAIENVIRNAVYYTNAGTEIRLALAPKAESGNNMIALTVSDCGPGVPTADTENIFKPFFRVAEARDRQSGGAGLGLAIASRVVKLHRGTIRAANRAEGGLEIRIELPVTSTNS
jgi:two-component system sensor histidine kinase CpxA